MLISSKNPFYQSIFTLMSGTFLAQILALLTLPVITRLYTQEDFGLFTSYQAVINFLLSVGTLKYDTAIIVAEDNCEAYVLLRLSRFLSIIVSLIAFLFLLLPISYFNEYKGMEVYLLIGAILQINNLIYYCWFTRFKKFKIQTYNKIFLAISVFIFQFFLYFIFQNKGLILGFIIGQFIANIYLTKFIKKEDKVNVSLKSILKIGRKYKKFPLYFSFSNVVDSISTNLPVLFFVSYISITDLGSYGIAFKILMQPVSLIAINVGNVVYSYMADKFRKKQQIFSWVLKNYFILFGLGILISIFVFLFAPDVFAIVLGNKWRDAGVLSIALIPILIFSMVRMISNSIVRVYSLQKYQLLYSIISLIIRCFALYYLFNICVSFYDIVLCYSLLILFMSLINDAILLFKIKNSLL